jgi:hypothetical protein
VKKMLEKNAQLSVETMIIYGVVILVALALVGGLIYFNVLDISSYLPDSCDIGGVGDLKCEEMKFTASATDNLQLGVRNVGQKPIESLTIDVTDKDGAHFSGVKSAIGSVVDTATNQQVVISKDHVLAPGDIALVSVTTGGAKAGRTFRGTLVTHYLYKDGVVSQEASGSLRIKAS